MKTVWQTSLDALFEKHPILVAGPASMKDIIKIENFAGFSLPEDYKFFLAEYGGAIVGPYRVFGSGKSEAMGKNEFSVIDITKRYRSDEWPNTEKNLVISEDHTGNPCTLDCDGEIWLTDHDNGTTEIIASNFPEFILDWCLKG